MVLVRRILALSFLSLLAQALPSPTLKPDVALPQSHAIVDSDLHPTLHQFQKRQVCYTFFFFWRWCFADDDDRDVVTTTFGSGQQATLTLHTVTTTTSTSTTAVNTARSSSQSSVAASSIGATTSVAASTSRPASSTAVATTRSSSVSSSSIAISSVNTPSTNPASTSVASASSLPATSSPLSSSVATSAVGSILNTASTIVASSSVVSTSTSRVFTSSTSSSIATSSRSTVPVSSQAASSGTSRGTTTAVSVPVSSSAGGSSSAATTTALPSSASSIQTSSTSLISSSLPISVATSLSTLSSLTATSSTPSTVISSTATATVTSRWTKPTLPTGWLGVADCMAEGTTGRALTGSSYFSNIMTVESCVAYCNVNGFSLAAVEYGSECYCASEYSNGADPSVIAKACEMPCAGNTNQLCGGPAKMSVFRNSLYVAPKLSLPAGWAATDPLCIAEAPGRALTGAFYAADNMTIDTCVAYCHGLGFPYAGAEYGRECMCGTELVNGASFDKPSIGCSMPCAGSTASNRQLCGGENALSVFYDRNYVSKLVLPTGWQSLGCIAEGTQGRALVSAQMESDSMTIAMCLDYCSSRGFGMAGLEYGRQCFCAKDSLSNGASLAVTSNQCYMPCAGSIMTPCGGLMSIDLYVNPKVATAVKEVASAVGTWKDSGLCLREVEGRALRGAGISTHGMTVEYCLNYCGGLGFLMAGVEYGTECYCGQSLEGGASTTLQSGECKMYCSGNTEQICGGPNAINYYTTDTLDVTVKLPTGWSNIGCVAEPKGHRALNVTASAVSRIQSIFMTGVACATACHDAGYALAATQYSTECRCGNALDVAALTVVDNKFCNFPCSGNLQEMCGGAYYQTLFSATRTVPLVA